MIFLLSFPLFLLQKSTTLHREDVFDLFPGIYATVEMVPDSVGDWLLHCHVNNHLTGGMETLFSVMEPTSKSATSTLQNVKTSGSNRNLPGH